MVAQLGLCDTSTRNQGVYVQDDILLFGGGGGRETRPQYVQNEWSLASEFIKDYVGTVCVILLHALQACQGVMCETLLDCSSLWQGISVDLII
jgi:hypothetical protein